jgi:hypothetical protein
MHDRMADAPQPAVTARDVARARVDFEQAIKGARDIFKELPGGTLDASNLARQQHAVELARLTYEDVRDRHLQQEADAAAKRSERIASVNKWIAIIVGIVAFVQTVSTIIDVWHRWRKP